MACQLTLQGLSVFGPLGGVVLEAMYLEEALHPALLRTVYVLRKVRVAPCRASAYLVHLVGFFLRPSRIMASTIWNSGLSVELGSGMVPSFAYARSALAPSADVRRALCLGE